MSTALPPSTLEEIELTLLFEGVYRYTGYDFRGYAPASRRRRVHHCLHIEGVDTVSALQARVLHDPAALQRLLATLSVHVTDMFRDPTFYRAFREQVVPLLRTYPSLRIWHAGCASGEEVYSMAILLEEAGLLDRTQLYATDLSDSILSVARCGRYPLAKLQTFEANYLHAGGTGLFRDYLPVRDGHGLVSAALRRNITWAQHNLVTDSSFNEFHVILCRNVMMYFSRPLQDHVHGLLSSSLIRFGVLGLGQHESLAFSQHRPHFTAVAPGVNLYRRTA